jgi:hypothetical protein
MTKGKTKKRRDDLPGGERSRVFTNVRPTRRAWYHARDRSSRLFDQGCGINLHRFIIGDLKVEL